MPAATAAMRFVLYGLAAMSLYTGYRVYFSSPPSPALATHTTGSLGTLPTHADGRTPLSRRTVAVADLHGDLAHALNVLSMASVLSVSGDKYTWVGGHDVLVSTGDIVDRGDDTIALYRLFITLREQAARAGGEVKNCLGNHEVMNALGDWRYVTAGDVKSFGGVEARRAAMSSTGWIGQDWLRNYNVTHTIPLLPPTHPALPAGYTPPRMSFVHGGITPHYATLGTHHINTLGHSFLAKALSQPTPTSWLPPNTTTDEQLLWSESGPLWYRGYASDPPATACPNAAQATQLLGVTQLVMGHTPHFDGFVTRCNNTVLLIDTGISRAYGGEQSALIVDFDLIPVDGSTDGKSRWIEKQTLTALYKGRKPTVLSSTETTLWL
ncbi:uncharacterized protein SRS1_14315 [Sporisorium reilianum f. sp. reilianum]|uniref:Calcineurin-like phosphoesterase domain-containing protein n=1 Tax=Sporisorium reilianum f. sp. reilianum TaxID=72559 RepID=A0A2N8UFG8_9BASI|nr:uncharacterized protein SRS1_14315 [Sporisorium reilianum f. sp. reilianum]